VTHTPGPFEQLLGIAVRLNDPDPEDTRDTLKDLSTWMWWYCCGEEDVPEGYDPIVADAAPNMLSALEHDVIIIANLAMMTDPDTTQEAMTAVYAAIAKARDQADTFADALV